MSIIMIDGCRGADLSSKWSVGSFGTAQTVTRFSGGASYTSCSLLKRFTAASEVFAAAAFSWNSSGVASNLLFYGDNGATGHIAVFRNAAGFIEARRGGSGGTLLGTGPTVIPENTWFHIQARCSISDTVGIVQVRLNGAGTNEIDFLGDTKNGGTNTTIDTVYFQTFSANYYVTDMVVLNTAGSVNNTWPGDCRVQTLVPNGNGASSQGVGSDSDSTNNYLLVDELPFSSTDYVGFTTNGDGDSYTMADLTTSTTTVKAVQVNMSAAKSDAGTKSIKRRLRSGGTVYTGPSVLLGSTYTTISEILEQDPDTSAPWTVSGVNAIEAGAEAAA